VPHCRSGGDLDATHLHSDGRQANHSARRPHLLFSPSHCLDSASQVLAFPPRYTHTRRAGPQALSMQLRHVWSRQYRHSQMNQNGPQWQTWHVHSIRVLSDLIMTNECAQWLWLASAILENVRLVFVEWWEKWPEGGPDCGPSQGRG
jgi:hypothetical protein